ncbi:MAG: hypothetical protein INR71_09130 [Terriglobus roseus]|nr:hypothetical protein [Terriglobus roseus]
MLVARGVVRLLVLDPHGLATVGGDVGDLDLRRPALALQRDAEPLAGISVGIPTLFTAIWRTKTADDILAAIQCFCLQTVKAKKAQ